MPIALEVLGNVNISRVNIGSYVAWAFCAKIVHMYYNMHIEILYHFDANLFHLIFLSASVDCIST